MNCNGCRYKEELSCAQDLLVLNERHIEELKQKVNDLGVDLFRARFETENRDQYIKLLLDTFTKMCDKSVIDHIRGKCNKEIDGMD